MTTTTVPRPFQLTPHLTLTHELYRAALLGMARHVPDLPALSWEDYCSADWLLVGDVGTGQPYKAERVLTRERQRTAKLNIWLAPDLRDGQAPKPHNHPWVFDAHVLTGFYGEDRWTVRDGIVSPREQVFQQAGQTNHIERDIFHEVSAIGVPGATETLMVTGPGEGPWGYVDLATGAFEQAAWTAEMDELERALNPHRR